MATWPHAPKRLRGSLRFLRGVPLPQGLLLLLARLARVPLRQLHVPLRFALPLPSLFDAWQELDPALGASKSLNFPICFIDFH